MFAIDTHRSGALPRAPRGLDLVRVANEVHDEEHLFEPIADVASASLFAFEIVASSRGAANLRRSLGPRIAEAARRVSRAYSVFLRVDAAVTRTPDVATLALDLDRADVAPARVVIMVERLEQLPRRTGEGLVAAIREYGFGWCIPEAGAGEAHPSGRAGPRRMRVHLSATSRGRGGSRCGAEGVTSGQLLTGLDHYDDLRAAVAAGADLVQGRALGGSASVPAPLRFTRRALLRSAAPSRRIPDLDDGTTLADLDDEVSYTIAALEADPDAAGLEFMVAGWQRLVESAAREARAARGESVRERASAAVRARRAGSCQSGLTAVPDASFVEALAVLGDAVARRADAFARVAEAEAARRRLVADLRQRRAWLHEALEIRRVERGIADGWAASFFRGK